MTVGWYVHHHGAGHLARLRATLPHLGAVTALSSHPGVGSLDCEHVALPLDLTPEPADPTAGETLHWVPLGHPGLRERMAAVSAWIARARPDVVVVDVSVEVALLARLHGVRVVLVAQRGHRTDAPHALAYAQAAAVAAPWTLQTHLEDDPLPAGRTHWVGAISRFDAVPLPPAVASGGDVLLLLGAGGHGVAPQAVVAAARATPERTWHVAGPVSVAGANVVSDPERTSHVAGPLSVAGANVVAHGPDADVGALLARCSVVVGSAGGNVVAEVAAARRPYVCLPQERPFDEQLRQAEALRRLGVAEVRDSWPPAEEWPATLAAAEARDASRWALLHDGEGAQRLAAVVREAADPPHFRHTSAPLTAQNAAVPPQNAHQRGQTPLMRRTCIRGVRPL